MKSCHGCHNIEINQHKACLLNTYKSYMYRDEKKNNVMEKKISQRHRPWWKAHGSNNIYNLY